MTQKPVLGPKALLLLSALTLPWQGALAKDHPYDRGFERRAERLFLEGQRVSPSKVDDYIFRLRQKQAEIAALIANYERDRGADEDEVREEVEEHKFMLALGLAEQDLLAMKNATKRSEALDLAYRTLDMEAAVRSEGARNNIASTMRAIGNYLTRWVIPKRFDATKEASNLVNPTGGYMDAQSLRHFRRAGGDPALLDPGPSTFWQKQQGIASLDVARAATGKTLDVYRNVKTDMPEEAVFYYDGMRHSDTKPKMDVYVLNDEGKKTKYKLKFGAEIHADPTLAAIMMTLGFPTDVTQYRRDIKIILKEGDTLSDVRRDWEVYFRRDNVRGRYLIEQYIKDSGIMPDGRHYVVFRDGLIEAKPKKIERPGGWAFGELGHSSLREVRALMLVQMWLDNTDVKEFDNNKTLLKETDGGWERWHILSDLGHSLGGILMEQPELYHRSLVAVNSPSALTLKYRSFVPVAIKGKITYADARWAGRLIGTLTRAQIERAVELGGWPACVALVYTEKMVNRRNDLLRGLDLYGVPDMDGRPLAPLPVSADDADYDHDRACRGSRNAETHTVNFDFSLRRLVAPESRALWHGLLDGAVAAIGNTRRITIYDSDMGFQTGGITFVVLNVRRDIEPNPSPASEREMFIVKDHLEIGMRLGAAWGVFADATYTRSFTLAYPARSLAEARLNNGFIVNALLPLHVAQGDLPERYVLKTEHYLEGGVGLDADNLTWPVIVGLRAGAHRVSLMRSFLDHREAGRYLLYRDRAFYGQFSLQAFLRLLAWRIPFAQTLQNWGSATGVGSSIPEVRVADEQGSLNLHKAVVEGDFTAVEEFERDFVSQNRFRTRQSSWNLVFWHSHDENRLDRIRLERANGSERESMQFQAGRGSGWWFFGDEETRDLRVEVYHTPNVPERPFMVRLKAEALDTDTTDREMGGVFLAFINGLSPDGRAVIPVTPGLGYTTNRRWGRTVTRSETTYYPEALRRLLAAPAAHWWRALGEALGTGEDGVARLRAKLERARRLERTLHGASRRRQALAEVNLSHEDYDLGRQAAKVAQRLGQAQDAATPEEKLRLLALMFREAGHRHRNGFYEPRLLNALNRLAGPENLYSRNMVTSPNFAEVGFMDGMPLFGDFGRRDREQNTEYLTYTPVTPTDLYFMFDTW